ncbi:MAG: putative rane protein insertion efficiency factor [Frankiales bacterium]|nr:putative rane protein insertion efficiency factor [Frankiales bacterium]
MRMSERAVRAIERYQRSPHQSGRCRFEPSCSEFAVEAFRSRRLPVAVVLTALRILRCNPLATRRTTDPVRRAGRRGPRSNGVPTALAVVAVSGFFFVMTAGVAQALGVSGGCTATINGKDPASMTVNSPLVVHKGETVSVTGLAPVTVRSLPAASLSSNTHIDVSVVEGVFGVSSSDHPGHGPNWGGKQNVDNYLKYGVGLYKVKGVATGTPGWSCDGEGYVKLADGNPLTKPVGMVGMAMAVIGAGAGALASRPKAAPTYPEEEEYPQSENEMDDDDREAQSAPSNTMDGFFGMGCLAFLMAAFATSKGYAAGFALAVPRRPQRLVWVRGHAIAGFISGVLLGIGASVLAQQFALWPLTIVTAIVFPLVCGLIVGLRAWMGRPWKVG